MRVRGRAGACGRVCLRVCERGVVGAGAEKYESIIRSDLHTLLNLAQQFTRFRKHHFADGQYDLVSPDLQYK